MGNGPIVHPVNSNTYAPYVTGTYPTTAPYVTGAYPTTAYSTYTPSIYPGQYINTPVISSNQVINYTKVPQIVPYVQRQ